MTKRLVIVGAGGFGREVLNWVRSSPRWCAENEIDAVVFIDDNSPKVPVAATVISSVAEYVPGQDDLLICAIGSPEVRRTIVAALSSLGAQFAKFVHDHTIIGSGISLGPGVVVCPNVLLSTDVRVGEHVHINSGCTIGHDVVIGDYVTMSSACNLTGGVEIGRDVFLATAVTVIPGTKIGDAAYVGAGSVVLKDVPPQMTVFGNPSKVVGKRTP